MYTVTSTGTYFESNIGCQSVYISAVSFLIFILYHCKLAIARQEAMSAHGQMEGDTLKPIFVDKGENISNHCVVEILSSAAVTRILLSTTENYTPDFSTI